MKDQQGDIDMSLEPLTRLLAAHAHLISETSETMVLDLANGVQDLLSMVAATEEALPEAAQGTATGLLSALQMQDILRQQIDVLKSGLDILAKGHVPEQQDPDHWRAAQLEELKKSYVMRSQYDLHADATGAPASAPPQNEDPVFF
jgi:ABC-type transporter Mla subunit MlaD